MEPLYEVLAKRKYLYECRPYESEDSIVKGLNRRDAARLAGMVLLDGRYFSVVLKEVQRERTPCWPDNRRLESADGTPERRIGT